MVRSLTFVIAGLALAGSASAEGGNEYLVRGGAMGNFFQHIDIWDGVVGVTNAVVTVNDVAIPFVGGARYSGTLDAPLAALDPITLRITTDSGIIEATDVVPEAAVVTFPAGGESFVEGETITVTWTSTTNPDYWIVAPFPCDGNCNSARLAGSAREYELALDTFPLNEPIEMRIYAYNTGTWTGPAVVESEMNVRWNQGPEPEFTVTAGTPVTSTSWSRVKDAHR